MIRAIIFDMDGVLVDSMGVHFEVWRELLRPYTNLSQKKFNSWSGKSTLDILSIVQKKYRFVSDAEEFKNRKNDLYIKSISKVKLFPNVKSVLEYLKGKRVTLMVATSETLEVADKLLKIFKIRKYFSVVVGEDMVKNAKPSPDIFLLASKLANYKPRQCLVVEDSPTGIEAAKAAGMQVIALPTTHKKEELQNATLITTNLRKTLEEFV